MSLTIWCNAKFAGAALRRLEEGTRGHRLIFSPHGIPSILAAGGPDPAMAEADVVFGQPDVADCLRYRRVRWVHLTTAGFARYDTDSFRENFRERSAALTKSSAVFAEPAAEHVLAMMLALDRQLLPNYRDQLNDRSWEMEGRRERRSSSWATARSAGGWRKCSRPSAVKSTPSAARRAARSASASFPRPT